MTAKQQSTESGGGLRTVTLTADQWNTLYFYLLTFHEVPATAKLKRGKGWP